MKKLYFITVMLLINLSTYAQNGVIKGVVKDAFTNEPIPFANIIIYSSTQGTTTDLDGNFEFNGLKSGFIKLQLSSVGYKGIITTEFNITQVRPNYVEIKLEATTEQLDEVKVSASPYANRAEAPVSLRRIGIEQIEKNAGANRDISKVIQSLPGVGSASTFRNDIFVRGGGPSENRFYIDDIEIPNINHFTTQGASGGPAGILNVDFIREVDFYSSAFPASKGNALSSVFEFKQIDVNSDKPNFKATLGASEVSLTTMAPLGEKTGLIASVRHSYLQFLFDALGLPFLPTFTDFQFKTKTRINSRNELNFLGVGAIDKFKLNPSPEPSEQNAYILGYIPTNNQWNYTIGSSWKHYLERSYFTFVLSRNHLNNTAYKYQDNIETPENLLSNYSSDEIENKFRVEYTTRPNDYTINVGGDLQYINYQNSTYSKIFEGNQATIRNYDSQLNFFKWAAFGNVSHPLFDNRLTLSAGLRLDANNYSAAMNNMIQQLSPRAAASFMLLPELYLNTNVGRYYQNPAYTTMGFRDNNQTLVNKQKGLKYIHADHFVAGLELRPNASTRVTLEGFYKKYADYPFSVKDSVSLASKGGDFGVFGDEEVTPTSNGQAYGFEVLYRTQNRKGLSLITAYTFVRSEFTDYKDDLVPSSWDSRHLFTLSVNQRMKRSWEVGMKWRFVGGLPYTPYDYNKSSLIAAWDVKNQQYLDYSAYNTQRLTSFHQLDLRVDKSYDFKNWTLGFYLDIQNVYNQQAQQAPNLVQSLDDNGNAIINATDPSRYALKELNGTSGTVLPTIGLMIEF